VAIIGASTGELIVDEMLQTEGNKIRDFRVLRLTPMVQNLSKEEAGA